jgi:hypothetical protein
MFSVNKKQPKRMWVYKPQAPKFTASEKAKMLEKVKGEIKHLPKLSQKVSRVDMRSNRVYLYEMVEQFVPEGAMIIKPLIDDKYAEFPYARITLNDAEGNDCTVDWQRHNNQWMTLHTGAMKECLNSIENDNEWFLGRQQ